MHPRNDLPRDSQVPNENDTEDEIIPPTPPEDNYDDMPPLCEDR